MPVFKAVRHLLLASGVLAAGSTLLGATTTGGKGTVQNAVVGERAGNPWYRGQRQDLYR